MGDKCGEVSAREGSPEMSLETQAQVRKITGPIFCARSPGFMGVTLRGVASEDVI